MPFKSRAQAKTRSRNGRSFPLIAQMPFFWLLIQPSCAESESESLQSATRDAKPELLLSCVASARPSPNPSGAVVRLFPGSCPRCADDVLGSSSCGETSEIPPLQGFSGCTRPLTLLAPVSILTAECFRIRGLREEPRFLATAASFPCKLIL